MPTYEELRATRATREQELREELLERFMSELDETVKTRLDHEETRQLRDELLAEITQLTSQVVELGGVNFDKLMYVSGRKEHLPVALLLRVSVGPPPVPHYNKTQPKGFVGAHYFLGKDGIIYRKEGTGQGFEYVCAIDHFSSRFNRRYAPSPEEAQWIIEALRRLKKKLA